MPFYSLLSGGGGGPAPSPAAKRGIAHNFAPELATGSGVLPVNRILWTRLAEGGPIWRLAFDVINDAGGFNVCLALAANDGDGTAAKPGELLTTTGIVGISGIGVKWRNLDQTTHAAAGDWIGIATDTSSVALRALPVGGQLGNSTLARGGSHTEAIPLDDSPAIPSTRGTITAAVHASPVIIGELDL